MIKALRLQRFLAMTYLGIGLGILYFWHFFYSHPAHEFELLLPSVYAYDKWLHDIVFPELLLSIFLLLCTPLLWFDFASKQRKMLIVMSMLALLSQGSVCLIMGFEEGFYQSGHPITELALEMDLSKLIVGLLTLLLLSLKVRT